MVGTKAKNLKCSIPAYLAVELAKKKNLSNLYLDLYSVSIIECCSEVDCILMIDEIVPTSGNMLAQNEAL